MKCPEFMIDKRTKSTGICGECAYVQCEKAIKCICCCHTYGIRLCGKDIYGMTGLQELQNFQKHLRTRHAVRITMMAALERRAESGQ